MLYLYFSIFPFLGHLNIKFKEDIGGESSDAVIDSDVKPPVKETMRPAESMTPIPEPVKHEPINVDDLFEYIRRKRNLFEEEISEQNIEVQLIQFKKSLF